MVKPSDTTRPSRRSTPRRRRPLKDEPAAFPTLLPIAERLERLRLARGLTQSALAARVGISANHYFAIAHAQANPVTTVMLDLARALGISVAELFEGSADPAPEWRAPLIADLHELAASCQRLGDVIERMATKSR